MATLRKFATREPMLALRRKPKPALFAGYWQSQDGQRLERATRADLREAVRLYWKHKDIREGKRRAA